MSIASDITDWFQEKYDNTIVWIKALFEDFKELLQDFLIVVFDLMLDGFLALLELIPVPDFINNGLAYYLSAVDPSVLYFLQVSGFPEALALLGTGFSFRITRKLVTLGRW